MAATLLPFIPLIYSSTKNDIAGAARTGPGGQRTHARPSNRVVVSAQPSAAYIPDAPASGVQRISQVRAGLLLEEAHRQIRELVATLGLTKTEMAAVLATPERTFTRLLEIKPAEKTTFLPKMQSERLLFLQQVAAHGLDVFEDQGKFNRWLRRPPPLRQNHSPLQLLDTATGFWLIHQLLGRIGYGVYS